MWKLLNKEVDLGRTNIFHKQPPSMPAVPRDVSPAADASASAASLPPLFRVVVICRSMCIFVACPLTHTSSKTRCGVESQLCPNSSHRSVLPSLHLISSPIVHFHRSNGGKQFCTGVRLLASRQSEGAISVVVDETHASRQTITVAWSLLLEAKRFLPRAPGFPHHKKDTVKLLLLCPNTATKKAHGNHFAVRVVLLYCSSLWLWQACRCLPWIQMPLMSLSLIPVFFTHSASRTPCLISWSHQLSGPSSSLQ